MNKKRLLLFGALVMSASHVVADIDEEALKTCRDELTKVSTEFKNYEKSQSQSGSLGGAFESIFNASHGRSADLVLCWNSSVYYRNILIALYRSKHGYAGVRFDYSGKYTVEPERITQLRRGWDNNDQKILDQVKDFCTKFKDFKELSREDQMAKTEEYIDFIRSSGSLISELLHLNISFEPEEA